MKHPSYVMTASSSNLAANPDKIMLYSAARKVRISRPAVGSRSER